MISCSLGYSIKPLEGVRVHDNVACFNANNTEIVLHKKAWFNDPDLVRDQYQSFFIQIKNNSDKTMFIDFNDVVLLDEERTQYDTIPVNYILQTLSILEEEVVPELDVVSYDDYKEKINTIQEGKVELISDAFPFGSIVPGAKKSGYIFFEHFKTKQQKFSVRVMEKEITYELLKSKK